MKRSVAALGAIASLALGACSGHSTNSITPYVPAAQNAAAPAAISSDSTPSTTFPGFADGVAFAEYTTLTANNQTRVVSGPLGDAPLACGTTAGTGSNNLASLSSPYATSTGAANQNYNATTSNGQYVVTTTSDMSGVNLLDGQIKADGITAIATTTVNAKGVATGDGSSSTATNIVVQGKRIKKTPAPNTKMYLNGYGYVVLNEQIAVNGQKLQTGGVRSSIQVNMIRVVINVPNNKLNIPVGTQIIVASAYSAFTNPPAPYKVNPTAYSLFVNGLKATPSYSGPWGIASVACNSNLDQHFVSSVASPVGNVGGLLNKTTASTSKATTAITANSVTGNASLLGGLIVAKGLNVTVDAKRSGTSFTQMGTLKFKSLTINGKAIAANVGPNTKIPISGLGYVMVNERETQAGSNAISSWVNAVDVYVTNKNNKYNLNVNAQVVLGHALAQIEPL